MTIGDCWSVLCLDAVRAVANTSKLAAVTLSAYDPAFDRGEGVRVAALAALRQLRLYGR